MKKIFYQLFCTCFLVFSAFVITPVAGQTDLPVGFSEEEIEMMKQFDFTQNNFSPKSITTPPGGPLRTMGQWEEMQALTISWITYTPVLREIVRAARQETQVYIVCGPGCGSGDSNSVKSYLTAGGVPLSNVHYLYTGCNSVWIRDYGQNSVYMNDVDSLILIDWKYNRPTRTKDDTVPRAVARELDVPLYEMIGTNQLINTGGNWMSDGLGTSFHSELIVDENPLLTVPEIDTLLKDFMGITRSIKMETLPYDGIHHIDMHMKLLNEETLLVGEYPAGIADGPQIEANLQYVLSNFNSVFGTPYKVIRIPQPPDQNNSFHYPHNGGNYLTYANSSIINKTVIVPQYYEQYDTTALRIWRSAMPGYNIVGINSNSTISASGSLHCITHTVGAVNPLFISHQQLPNTSDTSNDYIVNARIQHKTGIANATLFYTTDTAAGFLSTPMSLTNAALNTWSASIQAQQAGVTVYYYIDANANSGKHQVRPMTAPSGFFKFEVTGITTIADVESFMIKDIYPNPGNAITCIPVNSAMTGNLRVNLYDIAGNKIKEIFNGNINKGDKNLFIDCSVLPAGIYILNFETATGIYTKKLAVK